MTESTPTYPPKVQRFFNAVARYPRLAVESMTGANGWRIHDPGTEGRGGSAHEVWLYYTPTQGGGRMYFMLYARPSDKSTRIGVRDAYGWLPIIGS